MEITEILTKDSSSGRFHRRYRQTLEDGTTRMLVDERCQTDQSGAYETATYGMVAGAPKRQLCEFCFRVR